MVLSAGYFPYSIARRLRSVRHEMGLIRSMSWARSPSAGSTSVRSRKGGRCFATRSNCSRHNPPLSRRQEGTFLAKLARVEPDKAMALIEGIRQAPGRMLAYADAAKALCCFASDCVRQDFWPRVPDTRLIG